MTTAAFVTSLRLTDFRNHAHLSLDPGRRSVVLVGENGAGKTNILEAVSLLSPGRGLRRATRAQIARHGGARSFAVSALVAGPHGEVRIGTGVAADDSKRQVVIDGEQQKSTDSLTDHLRVLWLTPAMDGLFTGGSSERRRFLDRLVLAIDPGHGRRVAAFEEALAQRNRILEDPRGEAAWLDALEAQIAGLAVAVSAARREAVGCLARLVTAQDEGLNRPFPAAEISLEGDIETALHTASASDVEDWYRADLAHGRSRDRASGRTLVGPHRADLVIRHAAKKMPAALSSTGEQKALLIGLILAQAQLVAELAKIMPILLLDEITAHLDSHRREHLFAMLERIGCQVFMSGTDRTSFASLKEKADIVCLPI